MENMYKIVNTKYHRDFIRMNPFWYKELSRDPNAYEKFVGVIDRIKKDMQPSQLERIDKHINMAKVLIKLLGAK